MFKFNDTNILTGYIKEMLASFNLPSYKVYTRQQREHFEETGEELNVIVSQEASQSSDEAPKKHPCFVSYIKDGSVQQYVKNKEDKIKSKGERRLLLWQIIQMSCHIFQVRILGILLKR